MERLPIVAKINNLTVVQQVRVVLKKSMKRWLTSLFKPGVYRGKINIEMAGDWQAQITYEGAAGKGSFTLPVTVQ